jgi:hypothetical protein
MMAIKTENDFGQELMSWFLRPTPPNWSQFFARQDHGHFQILECIVD